MIRFDGFGDGSISVSGLPHFGLHFGSPGSCGDPRWRDPTIRSRVEVWLAAALDRLPSLPTDILWDIIWHIFWHSIWHCTILVGYIFWYSDILYSDVLFDIFWHFIWHICWHSIWHLFWHSIWHCTWYCICHTFRWISLTSYSDILTFISDMHSYILSNIYSDILWHSICHYYCIWHRFRGSPEILRAWILTRGTPEIWEMNLISKARRANPVGPFFLYPHDISPVLSPWYLHDVDISPMSWFPMILWIVQSDWFDGLVAVVFASAYQSRGMMFLRGRFFARIICCKWSC